MVVHLPVRSLSYSIPRLPAHWGPDHAQPRPRGLRRQLLPYGPSHLHAAMSSW